MQIIKLFNLKQGVAWTSMDTHFDDDYARWMLVAQYIRDFCGAEPTITSAHDGTHSINSVHYLGKAVDIRTKDWSAHVSQEHVAKTIAWILGGDYVVLLEATHLHIQIGVLNIKNPSSIEMIGKGKFLL